MDNASKNAGDMIGSLQMQYNRGRQASITNELVDIITGLSSFHPSVRGVTNVPSRCQCLVSSEDRLESGIDYAVWRKPVISRFLNSSIAVWIGCSKEGCLHRRNHSHLRPHNLDRASGDLGLLQEV